MNITQLVHTLWPPFGADSLSAFSPFAVDPNRTQQVRDQIPDETRNDPELTRKLLVRP